MDTIERINAATRIEDVVGKYLTLQPKGGRLWGLCPFHGEKTPSFSVTPEKNLFYCFGCHKGGNVFQFLQEMESLTFVEAAEQLAADAGIEIKTGEENPADRLAAAVRDVYAKLAVTFTYFLTSRPEGRHALDYILRRGISRETVETFALGYAPAGGTWLYGFLRKKQFSPEFLAKTGLFSERKPQISLFHDRLIFPIRNRHGQVIAFGGRSLKESGPKYINSPNTLIYNKREQLFGLDLALKSIRKQKTFNICEGYMDVLALHQAGMQNSIAPLGTSFTGEQARILSRITGGGKATLLFDGDAAGSAATKKSIITCEQTGMQADVVIIAEGKDPAEILQKEGAEALQNILKYPINSFDYLVKDALGRFDSSKPAGKEAIVRDLSDYFSNIESAVRRDACMNALSEALKVDSTAIFSDFYKDDGRQRSVPEFSEKKTETDTPNSKDRRNEDLFLMLAAAVNQDQFGYIRSNVLPEDLQDDWSKEVYIAMEDCFRREELTINGLLSRIRNPEIRELIIETDTTGEFSMNAEKLIRDGVTHIRRRSLESKRNRIQHKLQEDGSDANGNLRDLILEKMYLDSELQKLRLAESE